MGRRTTELLDAPDRRALRVFWRRTGLPEDTGENVTTAGFLRDQSLIPRANTGMKALEQGFRDGGLIAHPKV
jgi:hypothetical protein